MVQTNKIKAKEDRIKRRNVLVEGLLMGLLIGSYIGLVVGSNPFPFLTHIPITPAKPYLNTSHSPAFTPYIQNTSLWLTFNGNTYQYWATLDNYASGTAPCVLTMSAVENGSITHALNKTEASATLANVHRVQASGSSPKQPEYANPQTDYVFLSPFGGLRVCQNYNMTK